MGFKGTLRSINAELKRQEREASKRHRQYLKEAEQENALYAVQEYEKFIKQITSFHQDCYSNLDWGIIINEPEPQEPLNTHQLTYTAQMKINGFKPNFLQRLFRYDSLKKRKLEANLQSAILQDKQTYAENLEAYRKRKERWSKDQEIARRLNTDPHALIEALETHLNIEDLPVGQNIEFTVSEKMEFELNLKVLSIDSIVPEQDYSLRQSGTLSIRKMPKGKSLDLYHDYVCSALLRLAREVLGILPLQMIRANALLNTLNTHNGHMEDQVIISAIINRRTLETLNMQYIDPSDAYSNFIHNMNFRKTKGFEVVDKVSFPAI